MRRGKTAERGYGSRWQKASLGFRRSHPLCLGCEAIGRVEAATCVDHVEPHGGDQAKFWDRDNWQSACSWHHNEIKQKLEGLWRAGKIPASELWLNSASAVALSLNKDPNEIAQRGGG